MQYHWTLASVLHASRVGEKDKRLVLFSREMGKITAVAKGAAVPEAKWSSSFEPFSLLYLRLYERSRFLTVVSSEERIVYTDILSSLSRSLKGMAINQLLECILEPSSEDPELFAAYVTALSRLNIASDSAGEDSVFLQFCLDVLANLGFGLSEFYCEACGTRIEGPAFFSLHDNSFRCSACAVRSTDIALSPELAAFLRTGRGTLDHRKTLAAIALILRLLKTAAGKLGVSSPFEQFAQNAATLFRTESYETFKESDHEL